VEHKDRIARRSKTRKSKVAMIKKRKMVNKTYIYIYENE
jgi:hypothetical protein